jgi:hypothetical protein
MLKHDVLPFVIVCAWLTPCDARGHGSRGIPYFFHVRRDLQPRAISRSMRPIMTAWLCDGALGVVDVVPSGRGALGGAITMTAAVAIVAAAASVNAVSAMPSPLSRSMFVSLGAVS